MADEPAASLAPVSGDEVMGLFASLVQREGLTLLFTSHDLTHALRYAHRVIALHRGRVALDSLRGRLEAPAFTFGECAAVALPLADLLSRPDGARDRQVMLGAALTVVDRQDGWAFVQMARDGYCGWLPDAALSRGPTPTHWVCTPGTHLYPNPKVQAPEICALSLGAELAITAHHGAWAETTQGFLPVCHLMPLGQYLPDPVTVAESRLPTP